MPTDQTWVRPNFFDSIQLSHRNFWFRLNSWLTIGFQALIKINSDSKWLAGSWFKSTHDSKGLTEFRFKSTESFPEFWFKWLMTQHSGILNRINSWLNYTLNSTYIHSPVYFQNLFHSIWLSWAFWAFDLSVFPPDMTFYGFSSQVSEINFMTFKAVSRILKSIQLILKRLTRNWLRINSRLKRIPQILIQIDSWLERLPWKSNQIGSFSILINSWLSEKHLILSRLMVWPWVVRTDLYNDARRSL